MAVFFSFFEAKASATINFGSESSNQLSAEIQDSIPIKQSLEKFANDTEFLLQKPFSKNLSLSYSTDLTNKKLITFSNSAINQQSKTNSQDCILVQYGNKRLVKNKDYQVDYAKGQISILDTTILTQDLPTPITVSFECE